MRNYNLGFISDKNIYHHVQEGFDVVNEEKHIFACLLESPKSLPKKKIY